MGLEFGGARKGAFAEYVLMKEWQPLPIPKGVSDIAAALVEPCSASLHSVRLSGIKLGDKVGILGVGAIGLFVLQCIRAAGASTVIAVDPSPARREAAKTLGADILIDPKETNTVEALLDATDGLGPDLVWECAGAKVTFDQALTAVKREGRVIFIALGWEPTPVLPVEWVGREVELKTSYGYSTREWEIVLDLMAKGKVRVEPMVRTEDYFPLDRLQEAFEQCVNPIERIKAVIVP
jgi:(R,R)-butanediol dehydrogenase/meso-butanediol dehydrogenase/diacetyl reductase